MSTDAERVIELYRLRRRGRGQLLNKMREVADQYNGDITVPLPELDENELPAAVNLLGQGLDQTSMRVASVLPSITCPPVRDGFENREKLARQRQQALTGWWDMNKMGLKLRHRARYLVGYGSSPVMISAVSESQLDKRDIPHWRVRNPLNTFPSPAVSRDDIEPDDCIFCYRQPLSWLTARYPTQAARLYKGANASPDTMFEILEYTDAEETVQVVIGAVKGEESRLQTGYGETNGTDFEELDRVPNRADIPLVVMPGRITLDRLQGQFDHLLGKYKRAAKLDALELIAIQRSIFPQIWIVSHPNSPGTATIVREAQASSGQPGLIQNGAIQVINPQPGVQTPQAIDRLERAQRLDAGIPAEFGGESPTNVRTARRGEMVMSSTVDMPIQEYQEILAASLEAENVRAIAVQKAYYGSKATSFYLPRSGKVVNNDYTPNTAFETDINFVKYSSPGTDVNGLVIALMQRVGAGEMSLQTAREIDPMIEDATAEGGQVEAEGLRKALLASLEQQASQGALDLPTIAAIIDERRKNPDRSLEETVLQVHEKMQAQQAQNAQQPPQPTQPEAQPGLGQGQPAIPPAAPSSQNLAAILQSLRSPANQSKPEMGLGAPGAAA